MRIFASLRSRLLLVGILAILPALALVLINGAQLREQAAANATADALRLTHLAASNQDALIEGARQILIALAQTPQVREGNARECNRLLAALFAQFQSYTNIAVAAPNGDQICSALPQTQPVNIADRAYFQRAAQTRDFAVSEYLIGRASGKATISAAYPIFDDARQPHGVVLAGLDLAWMNQLAENTKLPAGSAITVIDRNGTLLARYPDPEKYVGKTFSDAPIIQTILESKREGTTQALGLDGVARVYAFLPLNTGAEPSAFILIGIPSAIIFAEADRVTNTILIGWVIVTALALSATWIGGDIFFVRQIQWIRSAAQRVGKGDLRARAGIASDGTELDELAREFDAMAAALEHQSAERQHAEEEIQRRAEEFAALYETTLNLSVEYELAALLQTIADNAAKLLKSNSAAMYLYDSARDELELTVKSGFPFPIGARLKMGEGMAGRVAQSHEPQIIDDYQTWESRSSLYEGIPFRAVAEVPMLYGGNLIGVLAVTELGESRRKYSPADLRLLSLFASPAASAVHNARLLEETRAHAEQLALLYDAGLTLNRVLDPRVQMNFLFKIAMKALRADSASFFRYDSTRDEARLEIGLGLEPADLAEMTKHTFRAGEERGLVGWVAQQRIPLYLPDVTTDSRWIPLESATHSALWVPIIHEQELRGVLSVTSARVNAFTPPDERLLILFANQISVAMENARLFEETRQRLKRLASLRAIDVAISSSLDLRVTLNVILEQVTQQLEVDASAVLLVNPHRPVLEYAASRGFRTREIENSHLRVGEGVAGRAAMERKSVFIPDLHAAGETLTRVEMFKTEDFVSCVTVPLVVKGEIKGVLEILHRARLNPDADWQDFLQALAGQAAIAIDNANLFQNLERSNTELIFAYETTIEGWSRALDLRDKETEGHTQRVTEMTLRLAQAMGIADEKLAQIRHGGLLHDIGKMGIPDAILLKPGALTPAEWELMRQHPVFAYELLAPIAYLRPALDIPYCHHEKWDGTGYPRGLKGEEIPLAARLFAPADVYDALTSDRPYRKAWDEEKTRAYLREQSGKHFEPAVVEAFMTVLNQV